MTESERNIRRTDSEPDMGFSVEDLKVNFAQLLRDTPDLVERVQLAKAFLQLMVSINPDNVEGLFGIKIIERNTGEMQEKDCFTYLVNDGTNIQDFHDQMFATHTFLKEPAPGAYALYLKAESDGLIAKHVGRVTDDLTVISKWGLNGHVYEHLPELVPTSYGSHIAYFSSRKN
jgi:hypothetical protein